MFCSFDIKKSKHLLYSEFRNINCYYKQHLQAIRYLVYRHSGLSVVIIWPRVQHSDFRYVLEIAPVSPGGLEPQSFVRSRCGKTSDRVPRAAGT